MGHRTPVAHPGERGAGGALVPHPTHPTHATNTQLERIGLEARVNLSDGHARLPLVPSQRAILERMPAIFDAAGAASQARLEQDFLRAFFRLGGQAAALEGAPTLLSYSASSGIQMLASLLSRRGRQVALAEPCFDNVPRLLQAAGNTLVAVAEARLDDVADVRRTLAAGAGALWITVPNNPTGRVVTADGLAALAEACRATGAVLVCDLCFRFFCDDVLGFDQYRVLRRSGASFAVIEDTGKTWSTLDMKVGLLTCSDDLYPSLYRHHDDLLLNVSPFHLALLTEFVADSEARGLAAAIREPVERNRETARTLLTPGVLELGSTDSRHVPFEWYRLVGCDDPAVVVRRLRERGVEVLPGGNFFWTRAGAEVPYLRVPLSRPHATIARGVAALAEVLGVVRRSGHAVA